MPDDELRSRAARRAAESALVRVVHHYGSRPEFVVLGGLVPELLCAASPYQHAGTTDVDVQVDLEIACGSVNTLRLEQALRNAEFEPDDERVWRWRADGPGATAVVRFELLADLDDQPAGAEVRFDDCEALGAANLRGTGFASRDFEICRFATRIGGIDHIVEVNVTGLAGFLLAKSAAARSRRKSKDWYALPLTTSRRTSPTRATRAPWRTPNRSSSTTPTSTTPLHWPTPSWPSESSTSASTAADTSPAAHCTPRPGGHPDSRRAASTSSTPRPRHPAA